MATKSRKESPSLVFGPQHRSLWSMPLGALIERQSKQYSNRSAVSFPWQGVRMTYEQLAHRSHIVAKSLIHAGIQHGDCVGIMAGNCYQYIEMFLGAGRIGCRVVVLNNTYSPKELMNAVTLSSRILCVSASIGQKSLQDHIQLVCTSKTDLKQVILLSGSASSNSGIVITPYDDFISIKNSVSVSEARFRQAEGQVQASDILNLQFTSGTTGAPKAAMLTHINLINNGRYVGERLMLTPKDVLCCPAPLFHCFGLVMGFLGAFTNGSSIVFPSDQFDANSVLDAVASEKCTVLYGVPTMFLAELEANKLKQYKTTSVRTGLAAGAPVPLAVIEKLQAEMGMKTILNAYGMTETSPVTFMTSIDDSKENRLKSIGTVMPHTGAKIINGKEEIVPRGVRGEICTSGYALQKGYWKNEEKTKEVMKRDENGILWMHTGDEGVINENGYCIITGRIKDIIIRGGENIFPVEIEERLLAHPAISEASVVGIPDERYGEVVGCFLRKANSNERPNSLQISDWVREAMGRHKAPKYVWWIGEPDVGDDFPKTGSGKHQKHILKDIGQRLMENKGPKARL